MSLETPQNKQETIDSAEGKKSALLSKIPSIKDVLGSKLIRAMSASALIAIPEPVAESDLSMRDREIAESVFGEQLVEDLYEQGMYVRVPVTAGDSGSYIVHVGQIHDASAGGFIEVIMTNDEVLEFQNKLYELLPKLTEALDNNVVFHEAVGDDLSDMKQDFLQAKSDFERLQAEPINDLRRANLIVDYILWYRSNQKFKLLPNIISFDQVHALEAKVTEYLESFEPKDEDEREVHTAVVQSLSASKNSSLLQVSEDNNDAVLRLYAEDKIEVEASETMKANQVAMEMINPMRRLAREYELALVKAQIEALQTVSETHSTIVERLRELNLKRDRSSEEETELETLHDKLQAAEKAIIEEGFEKSEVAKEFSNMFTQYEFAINTNRENVALGKIAEYDHANGVVQHPIIVFGNAHEFGPELEAFNASNHTSDVDRGLIEIKIVK